MIATWYPVKESLTDAAVDLETIVMLKRSMSLLLQIAKRSSQDRSSTVQTRDIAIGKHMVRKDGG